MATRGDLINRIITELHLEHTSYTAQVAYAIDSAVAFYRSERFWFNEGSTQFTVATSSTINISSTLPDSVMIDTVKVADESGSTYLLTPETYEEMVAHATMTAAPENYAIQAQMIHLWPSNDVTRTIVVSWAGRVTMSASNSSSCVWTNEAEELIRMHSTVDLCENFLLDLPRADRARGREAQALQQILSETVKRLGIGRNMRAFL